MNTASPSAPADTLLSAGDLADKTGHHRVSIHRALRRLNVKPALTVRLGALYHPDTAAYLLSVMRKPGGRR